MGVLQMIEMPTTVGPWGHTPQDWKQVERRDALVLEPRQEQLLGACTIQRAVRAPLDLSPELIFHLELVGDQHHMQRNRARGSPRRQKGLEAQVEGDRYLGADGKGTLRFER